MFASPSRLAFEAARDAIRARRAARPAFLDEAAARRLTLGFARLTPEQRARRAAVILGDVTRLRRSAAAKRGA